MRHLKAGRALGVKPAHRRAMLRNLVTSLIEKEQIKTTVARAKEMRKPLDHMITLGKKGDLSARRQALAFVKGKLAISKLFGELAERYQERPGGFTRILRIGPRRGDGAEMAMILLVGNPNDPFAEEKSPRRKGGARKKPKKVLEEVAEKVRGEGESGDDKTPAADPSGETKADATPPVEAAVPKDGAPEETASSDDGAPAEDKPAEESAEAGDSEESGKK